MPMFFIKNGVGAKPVTQQQVGFASSLDLIKAVKELLGGGVVVGLDLGKMQRPVRAIVGLVDQFLSVSNKGGLAHPICPQDNDSVHEKCQFLSKIAQTRFKVNWISLK